MSDQSPDPNMGATVPNPAVETPIEKLEAAVEEFAGGLPVDLKVDFDGTFTAKNEFGVDYTFSGKIVADLKGTPS
jgi:hypothetical protein